MDVVHLYTYVTNRLFKVLQDGRLHFVFWLCRQRWILHIRNSIDHPRNPSGGVADPGFQKFATFGRT